MGVQDGCGEPERLSTRALRLLAPALCLATVVAACSLVPMAQTGGTGSAGGTAGSSPAAPAGSADADAAPDQEGSPSREGEPPGDQPAAEGTAPGSAPEGATGAPPAGGAFSAISSVTFMGELEEAAARTDDPQVGIAWEEPRGLAPVAGDILDRYAACGTARLATSGFIDIKGNVWGAVIEDGRGWVDVVTVTEAPDGASSTARVIRMLPRGGEGS